MIRGLRTAADRRRQLLDAWEWRCRGDGDLGHCSGPDALFLVSALSNALRHGGDTPELGRAARTWGARFAAPVDALGAICQLREAVLSLPSDPGVQSQLASPVTARVFDQVMMEAVDASSANLRSAARIDSLTGCANRRALDEELAHALASAKRSGLEVTLAIIDLDGLKTINDTEGHAVGDAALVDLVTTLRKVLREADTLYRTGGDEFVVLTPFTDAAGARSLMRRAEQMGAPSFSWGVAGSPASLAGGESVPTDPSLEDEALALLAAADADLYARRWARRREAVRARRKHRAVAFASVAASAATLASGAGLASALAGRWFGSSGQPSSTTRALPGGAVGGSGTMSPMLMHPPSFVAAPGAGGGTRPSGALVTSSGVPRPALSGPDVSGPALSGPALSGPDVSAPMVSDLATVVDVVHSQPVLAITVGAPSPAETFGSAQALVDTAPRTETDSTVDPSASPPSAPNPAPTPPPNPTPTPPPNPTPPPAPHAPVPAPAPGQPIGTAPAAAPTAKVRPALAAAPAPQPDPTPPPAPHAPVPAPATGN